jgi:glycosyltransferase involved in cell wall biosynthesis
MLPKALTVGYCGPIARRGEPARGGFEAANRRLIDDLERAGLNVIEFAYAPERKSIWRKALAYGTGFTGLALRIAFGAERLDVFHITPLRRHFILLELLLCRLATWRGAKLVVDIRAGAIAEDTASRSRTRRAALKSMLGMSDLICVEGEVYLELFASYGKDMLYLPNYVDDDMVAQDALAPAGQINLVFLGRIVPEKGIETVIDCARALQAKGRNPHIKVIGRGDDAYVARLKASSKDLPVLWLGAISHAKISTNLRDGHFFVFPTYHRGEGHSNALTEAMSQGLVPLATDNGFNRQVIADAGVVFDIDATGADYAEAIEEIIDENKWQSYSAAARQRVVNQFTGQKLVPALVERYRALFGGGMPAAAKTSPAIRQEEAVVSRR